MSEAVYCPCGDAIVPDDGAACGTCHANLGRSRDEWKATARQLQRDAPLGNCTDADACPTYCDGCHCTVEGLRNMIEAYREEKAKRERAETQRAALEESWVNNGVRECDRGVRESLERAVQAVSEFAQAADAIRSLSLQEDE